MPDFETMIKLNQIASQLNPSHQTPQTRSKMIQQLVSMGFKVCVLSDFLHW